MEAETPKSEDQTTVRISRKTKERVQRVARKIADREDRRCSEVEIADEILAAGLPRYERRLGIKLNGI